MTRVLEKSSNVAELFSVAPSVAVVGIDVSARTQFRQFATGCGYLNLPKPIVTLFPNTTDDFSAHRDWKDLIHEVMKFGQQTTIVQAGLSSILPVAANDEHHAHFIVETTSGSFCFDDLIMEGMPSLQRACL